MAPLFTDLPTSYSVGTATVAANGTAVTGQGTVWLDSLRVGDLFGTHKGYAVRISAIASNTSLTLAYGWPGAAQTATAYEIQLTPRSVGVQEATRQLLTLLANGNLSAFSELTTAADKLPYFTGVGGLTALADFSAFGRSLVDDANAAAAYATLGTIPDAQLPARIAAGSVDASTDFNTALSNGFYLGSTASVNAPATGVRLALFVHRYSAVYVVQTCWQISTTSRGWTRTLFNGTWTAWQLVNIPILGTVAQSAGVPTGAIIERGSNANGEYVRFADGTQICYFNNITFTKAAGNIEVTWVFPIAFSVAPNGWVNANARSADGGAGRTAYFMGVLTPSATQTNVIISQMDGATAQTGTWSGNRVFAIGRWF